MLFLTLQTTYMFFYGASPRLAQTFHISLIDEHPYFIYWDPPISM